MATTTVTRVTIRKLSRSLLFAKHSRRVPAALLSTSTPSPSDRVSPEAPSMISWDSKQPIRLRMRDRDPENMPPFCIQVRFNRYIPTLSLKHIQCCVMRWHNHACCDRIVKYGWDRPLRTLSAIRSFCRFGKEFSESSPYLPGLQGFCIATVELSENILQNLGNDLMADSVQCSLSPIADDVPKLGVQVREGRGARRQAERGVGDLDLRGLLARSQEGGQGRTDLFIRHGQDNVIHHVL